MILLVICCALIFNAISGDAAIYFTFIKNFFDLPFSFGEGSVSFGATSPFHVLINSAIYLGFGLLWISAAKLFAMVLLAGGMFLIGNYLRIESARASFLLALLIVSQMELLLTAVQLYETACMFFSLSLLLYLYKSGRHTAAVFLSGFLYLVRPELLGVGILCQLVILMESKRRALYIAYIICSYLPAFGYHLYLYSFTDSLIPSSVTGRKIVSSENDSGYLQRLLISLKQLAITPGSLLILGAAFVATLRKKAGLTISIFEAAIFFSIFGLYVIFPPGQYMPRYVLPVVPVAVIWLYRFLSVRKWAAKNSILLALGLLAIGSYAFVPKYFSKFSNTYDTLLLKDLSQAMNGISGKENKILIYEIQSQYYLEGRCISMDGIVGAEFHDVLLRKEDVTRFLYRSRVRYIVTMNSMNYRPVLRNPLFEKLYEHDHRSKPGDTLSYGPLGFRKITSNPVFADEHLYDNKPAKRYNYNEYDRVYGSGNEIWKGHPPFWNSVYEVIYPAVEL